MLQLCLALVLIVAWLSPAFADQHPTDLQLRRSQRLQEDTLKRIGEQSSKLDQNYSAQAHSHADSIRSSIDNIPAMIKNDEEDLDRMKQARWSKRTSRAGEPVYTLSEINAARADMAWREAEATRRAEQKNEYAYQSERKAANTIQDIKQGLESQLGATQSGGVQLSPLGTNLYVRNYTLSGSSHDEEQAPSELRAQPYLMHSTSPRGWTSIPVSTQTAVSGRLIQKNKGSL